MFRTQPRTRTAAYAIAAVLLTLFIALRQRPHLTDPFVEELIKASTQTGIPFGIPLHLNSAGNNLISAHLDLYDSYPVSNLSSTLQHLEHFLHCAKPPDPTTGHIRLPQIHHHNISLHEPNTPHDPSARHFNPTIIPLPSYAASSTLARYILVTRLVTPGLHQESLACLATFCLPHPYNHTSTPNTNTKTTLTDNTDTHTPHLPPDTHPCHPTSLSASSTLGPSGGLRCLTPPRRLNIPPTPAKHCTGEWASFPDIPGFHDPRIMWSNLGEPLIMVNSASQYGCVGLWVVDLRVLVPELGAVMERRGVARDGDGDGGEKQLHKRAREDVTGDRSSKIKYSQPVIRYRTPMELTRWEGRGEVEKNWILWFPGQDGEAWVSYELFGTWKKKRREEEEGTEAAVNVGQKNGESRHETPQALDVIPPWPPLNFSELNDTWPANASWGAEVRASWNISSISLDDDRGDPVQSAASTSRNANNTTSTTILSPNTTTTAASSAAVTNKPEPAKRSPSTSPSANGPAPPSIPPSNAPNHNSTYTFHRGRALSRLLSHGLTSPNLTSPTETPCLLPFDALGPRGREGHWHQSTPALRVRLCWRSSSSLAGEGEDEGRKGGSGVGGGKGESGKRRVCGGNEMEDGDEVFFALVHRKFSDGTLGMPLRYERFVVVWEARYPFSVLGVGQGAVVFGGEVVRGFEADEKGGGEREAKNEDEDEDEDEDEGEKEALRRDRDLMRKVGFTYTTSIAWAWRPVGAEEQVSDDAEHLSRLGMGYLGDEVIVGVGLDDVAQVVVRVKVEELLGCLRLCPRIRRDQSSGSL